MIIGLEIAFELVAALAAVLIGKRWLISDNSVIADLLEIVFPAVAFTAILTGFSCFRDFDTQFFITRMPVLQEYLRLDWLWLKVAAGLLFALFDGFCLYVGMRWVNAVGKKNRSRKNKVSPIA